GSITFRNWHPVGVDEYGYAAPDPLNPELVYGGRNVTRYNKVTGQREAVGPAATGDVRVRTVRTAPVMFSPTNPHVLYFAGNTLWKTSDGGAHWQQISPDLSRKTWQVPASVGIFKDEPSAKPTQRGVIYTIAPSPVDSMTIWAGTDDGTIHVTRDGGKTWQDVTPPQLVPWAKVSIMDAGHHDANTAYAAVNTIRLDDLKPYIYRTHDGGKTWTEISNGIPDGETVNVVRQAPERKDLLFAGTERATYVSFDDGDHWQSLRLNMPATSVRDLIIHDNDLIVATHGRGFWILDDMTPIREMTPKIAGEDVHLFKPETATRVRWDTNTDTPLPADEPAAQNPPDGAVIDYWLKSDVQGPVTLEILGAGGEMRGRPERREGGEGGEPGEGGERGEGMTTGRPAFFGGSQQQGGMVIRRYTSGHPIGFTDSASLDVPTYWLRAPQEISTKAGLHRFVWDLHYTPLPGGRNRLPIAAVPHNTVVPPNSPWVAPGTYTVRLTVGDKSYTQPLTVRLDPRIKKQPTALRQQATLTLEMYQGAMRVQGSIGMLHRIQEQVKDRIGKAQGALVDSLKAFNAKADSLIGQSRGRFFYGGGGPENEETLNATYRGLSMMMSRLEASDAAPMDRMVAASVTQQAALQSVMSKVMNLMNEDLKSLNDQLKKAKLEQIEGPGEGGRGRRGRPRR
ncbi:MAG: glycoside hydrolase, partial [Gemmatimonadota bacterium]